MAAESRAEDLTERLEELEDTIEVLWAALIAPLWDRLERIERALRDEGEYPGVSATLEDVSIWHVLRAVRHYGGKAPAARHLRINPKTVFGWLQRLEKKKGSHAPYIDRARSAHSRVRKP